VAEVSRLGSGLILTEDLAKQYLDKAKGDTKEAERLAREDGYEIPA
jgi:hypothetical protein